MLKGQKTNCLSQGDEWIRMHKAYEKYLLTPSEIQNYEITDTLASYPVL